MKKRQMLNWRRIEEEEKQKKHFAQGLSFYKLFWVFFIGCFMGVLVETLWCLLTRHMYESRVGLIYGPFNLVYGFGTLALALGLHWARKKPDFIIMIGGAVIGSVVEYVCSWVQQTLFGTVSWDYSEMLFNINGRINLLYTLFWGILAVLWVKVLYPLMTLCIMKIPNKVGKGLSWALLVFMAFNTVMSALAVDRWTERKENQPDSNAVEVFMDQHYPDERMEQIYANMKFAEDDHENALHKDSHFSEN